MRYNPLKDLAPLGHVWEVIDHAKRLRRKQYLCKLQEVYIIKCSRCMKQIFVWCNGSVPFVYVNGDLYENKLSGRIRPLTCDERIIKDIIE
jgi:hypothetical protein